MMPGNPERAAAAIANVLPPSTAVWLDEDSPIEQVVINGVPVRIRWVGEGWLNDVRPLLNEVHHGPTVAVARRMSPGACEALRGAGLGWVDETGAAEIVLDSILVSRTGIETKRKERSPTWTPSVLAVAEALLCGIRGTVAEMKAATGLSTGSCSMALKVLEDRHLVASLSRRGRNSARLVSDSDQLLKEYAAAVDSFPTRLGLVIGVLWRDPVVGLSEIGEMWDKAGISWACTGAVAAAVLAPYLTSEGSAVVYVDSDSPAALEHAASRVGLRPMEGGRLTVRPFPTVTARRMATQIGGLRVAPWPRVYADLRRTGVRGEAAAEHLRELINAQ